MCRLDAVVGCLRVPSQDLVRSIWCVLVGGCIRLSWRTQGVMWPNVRFPHNWNKGQSVTRPSANLSPDEETCVWVVWLRHLEKTEEHIVWRWLRSKGVPPAVTKWSVPPPHLRVLLSSFAFAGCLCGGTVGLHFVRISSGGATAGLISFLFV